MKRLFFPGLMILALLTSCKKTEYTTIVRNLDGTKIAISYEEPLSNSLELTIHANGNSPNGTINVFFDNTQYDDITQTPFVYTIDLNQATQGRHYLHFQSITSSVSVPIIIGEDIELGDTEYSLTFDDRDYYVGEVLTVQVKKSRNILISEAVDEWIVKPGMEFYYDAGTISFEGTDTIHDKTYEIEFDALHIGATSLHLHNDDFDTTIEVTVASRFEYQLEPNIDFDDTPDSMTHKLGNFSSFNSGTYRYNNYLGPFTLFVVFNDGTIYSYYIVRGNDVDYSVGHSEMQNYITERYNLYNTNNALFYIDSDRYSSATILLKFENDVNMVTYYSTKDNPYFSK